MEYTFSVTRNRQSATQGTATVSLNGKEIITFGDTIDLVKEGQPYFGEDYGGWASTKPDGDFIHGVLFHPHEELYHYSDRVRTILKEECLVKHEYDSSSTPQTLSTPERENTINDNNTYNTSDYSFKAYVVNTAAFDAGYHDDTGAWLYFPPYAEEIIDTFEKIGLPHDATPDMYFMDDYVCKVEGIKPLLHRYGNIDELAVLAKGLLFLQQHGLTESLEELVSDTSQAPQTLSSLTAEFTTEHERAYVRELLTINMEDQQDAGYLSSADINVLNKRMDVMVDEYIEFAKGFPKGYADIALDIETDKLDEIVGNALKREQQLIDHQMNSMEMG